jgi:hypothetical protein
MVRAQLGQEADSGPVPHATPTQIDLIADAPTTDNERGPSAFDSMLESLDPSFAGWRLSPKDQRVIDTVLHRQGSLWGARADPGQGKNQRGAAATGTHLCMEDSPFQKRTLSAHEAATWQKRAARALLQFPRHWLRTNLTCVMPTITGMLTIFVFGAFPRRMASELPHITATFLQFEYLCEVRSDFSQGLQTFNTVLLNTIGNLLSTAILCAMVATKAVLPPAMKYYTMQWAFGCTIWVLSLWLVQTAGASPKFWWSQAATAAPNWVVVNVATLCIVRTIGCKINDSTFWWKNMLLNLVSTALGVLTYNIWTQVPYFSDTMKAAYIVIAHPVIFEMFLTVQRLIIRSMPEHVYKARTS